MHEQELRSWVAERLGINQFRREFWEVLPQEIRKYAESNPDDRDILLTHAKGVLKAVRLTKNGLDLDAHDTSEQQDSGAQESVAGEYGEYERERAAAYAEYRAKLAADDIGVRGFRRRVFGGENELLAAQEAERFLANGTDRGSLSGLSRRLSRIYPWTQEQAAWFILTGEAPEIAPISGHISRRWGKTYTYGTITLEVEPWVSPDVVRDTYALSQKKALGHNARRIKDRNLALFRFVLREVESIHEYNLRERGRQVKRRKQQGRVGSGPPTVLAGPPWRVMMRRWNEGFPEGHEWRYKDVQNFSRDFRNAERYVANPV